MKNKFHVLWPIFIGELFNEEHKNIKADLISFFKKYEKDNPEGRGKTDFKGTENYNLYESKYNLHQEKNDSLKKIFNFIAKGFATTSNQINQKYIENLENKKPNCRVNFKNSWFIRYNKGGAVMPHDHGLCSLSCVYYVQIGDDATKDNGSTYFVRPYHRGSTHGSFSGKNYENGATSKFIPREGGLLVWPSFLMHGSVPYNGTDNRIIISANADVEIE